MSHSKRNTSRPVFTAHERAIASAAWGASSARLARESFLPLGACGLCLAAAARDPVACAAAGDVFCRECALADLLAQRREIKRAARVREQAVREDREEQDRQAGEESARAVRDFERVQAGLEAKVERLGLKGRQLREQQLQQQQQQTARQEQDEDERKKRRESNGNGGTAVAGLLEDGTAPLARLDSTGSGVESRGAKRKFELDEDEMLRMAGEERAKARREIENEKAAKPVLPSFWTPSVTPSSNTKDILHEVKKAVKTQPTCPASKSGKPHSYSLPTLVTVHFTEDTDPKNKTTQRICPSCSKVLSNAAGAMLAKPCGHVICKSCVAKFMTPPSQPDAHSPGKELDVVRCYVCDADLTERRDSNGGGESEDKVKDKDKEKIRPGLVELRSEGTGFSAGGANQVRKNGVAYQA